MKLAIVLVSFFLLAACSLTRPQDVGKARSMTLAPLQDASACQVHLAGGLKVDYPLAPDDLDTYRIAILDKNARRDYLARMRWSEFLPGLIQSALVQSISANSITGNVFSDEQVVATSWELIPEIQKFEVVYADANSVPNVMVQIRFVLRHSDSLRSDKQFTLSQTVTAGKDTAADIVEAFRQAFNTLQAGLIDRLGHCE